VRWSGPGEHSILRKEGSAVWSAVDRPGLMRPENRLLCQGQHVEATVTWRRAVSMEWLRKTWLELVGGRMEERTV
jgi:hypothetical protein